MEYVGIFLILVAAGLRVVSRHLTGTARREPATSFRAVHAVPPNATALLLAAAGFFIFLTSLNPG
ncbi:hypothetical protein AAHB33_03220 [Paenarthrobacter sp. S56]|uniref:hypothetical protein n=1 Tax=Paenarthrobacter sp. S56 TaxID=3138179 RepID=UPI003219363D